MSTDLTEEKNCMYLLLQDYVVQANFLYTLLEEYKSNSNAIIQNCINVNKSVWIFKDFKWIGGLHYA